MADWDGHGLPPAVAERVARFHRHPVATSLLEVPDAVALASVGLTPVGEVMGCIVQHMGWPGGCGWSSGRLGDPLGHAGPYVDALYRGFGTALSRMGAEAQAMAADGVVGVKIVETTMGGANREFMAMGTAVRAASQTHLARRFLTDASGPDVAKLMRAGWVPVSIAIGISVAVGHDNYTTQRQARRWSSSNVEVAGYTELVQYVRAEARRRFDASAMAENADAATVSEMTLSISKMEPGDRHVDHAAECRVVGNSIARFHQGRHAISSTLAVLPLG